MNHQNRPNKNKPDLEQIIKYIQEKNVEISPELRKVVQFFHQGNVLAYLFPSGFGHSKPDLYQKLAECTGVTMEKTRSIAWQLEQIGVLGEEKGLSSLAGKEYEYGLTRRFSDAGHDY